MIKLMKCIITEKLKLCLLVGIFFLIIIFPVASEGFRNFTSFIFYYYFDETCRLDSQDVLLIPVIPVFLIKVGIIRTDTPDWYRFSFMLGPVISFTKTCYMDSVFRFDINSMGEYSYMGEANLTKEAEKMELSFGFRGIYFLATGYYYLLPSISGVMYPVPKLRLFSKLFFSWDRENVITGSVWGEASWEFTPVFIAHSGFTVSYANGFGYSLIAGFKLVFTKKNSLKYFIRYLSDTIEYLDEPRMNQGIANGLILDIRF